MRGVARALVPSLLALSLVGTAVLPAAAAPAAEDFEGRTYVVVAPGVYDLLAGAGIDLVPLGAAQAAPFKGTVRARFPITELGGGGNVIKHAGGLKFRTDDVKISAQRFKITLDAGTVSGKVSGSEVGDVGRATLFTLAATDDPELGAVRLLLTDAAAGAFNATFGTELAAGDLFGYATPKPKA